MKARMVRAVDLFCGGGGTSTGLALAVQALGGELGRNVQLVAINHWQAAIATHAKNHPWAQHRCERVEAVDRTDIFPGERLDLLVASPECIHWSDARGDKPVTDQGRAGAWYVLDWVGDLKPRACLIENVPAFMRWGRIEKGRQVKSSEGSVYKAYLRAWRALGYNVQPVILNSADYGAATSRRRFYLLARYGRKPIHVPAPTHSKVGRNGQPTIPGTLPWRAAREILDFTLPSRSIFRLGRPSTADTTRTYRTKKGKVKTVCGTPGCKRAPLHGGGCGPAQRTLDRIAKGIRSGPHGEALEPLARAVETCTGPVPLADIIGTAGLEVLQAWTLGQHGGAIPRPDAEPIATVAAGGALRLVEAIIVGAGGAARQGEPRSPNGPLPAVLTRSRLALADPRLIHLKGTGGALPIDRPVPALNASGEHVALAEPFILPPQGIMGGPGANKPRRVDEDPVQAITAQRGGGHLVEPGVLHLTHGVRAHDPANPLPAVTGANRGELALVEFLTAYYGNGTAQLTAEPLSTATGKDRFALVQALLEGWVVDVLLRMLAAKELAAAMGFPPDYVFTGSRTAIVKQIGNAVEVNVARALCTALLTDAPAPVLPLYESPEAASA